MNERKFPRTKLALALASALAGGLAASNVAQAQDLRWDFFPGPQQPYQLGRGPILDNNDRLGDAAIFQYYTAKGTWQTLIRLINTSGNAIVVKVRFREAANSRESLDFAVALSPYDVWVAWTDADALGDKGDGPGIRTNDRSCLWPPASSDPEGWVDLSTPDRPDLKGALFKDRAFTGPYFDGNGNVADRLHEGHIEVIGVAQYDPNGDSRQRDFVLGVRHGDDGYPVDCASAWALLEAEGPYGPGGPNGTDMDNVLAANAYLISVSTGQGAGYDPDILYDCTDHPFGWPLEREYNSTDTSPDLDSCTAGFWGYNAFWEGPVGIGPIAVNQRRSNGAEPPPVLVPVYEVDIDRSGAIGANTVAVDIDGDGVCTNDSVPGFPYDETAVPENNVPQSLWEAANDSTGTTGGSQKIIPYALNGCQWRVVSSSAEDHHYVTNDYDREVPLPWRIKQKGKFLGINNAAYPGNQMPVTGGVDNVSQEFMRTNVINEWAASYNPDRTVIDYFTQWVLTFPTKHYYVDLQDDPIVPPTPSSSHDDISPTLIELPGDDAFAPFTEEFDEGEAGKSCELFNAYIWNREERGPLYTSPQPSWQGELCYETNVLNFGPDYVTRGLASAFSHTIDDIAFPDDVLADGTFKQAERGWADLEFIGRGTYIGLGNPRLLPALDLPGLVAGYYERLFQGYNWYGLPVTGFMFSVYNTVTPLQNHTTVNAHKYRRHVEQCDPGANDDPCPTLPLRVPVAGN